MVHNCPGDADTVITQCALQYAAQRHVVVDDTDVLVLLMHHWKQNMADIYFFSAAGKKLKIWRIGDLVRQDIFSSYMFGVVVIQPPQLLGSIKLAL